MKKIVFGVMPQDQIRARAIAIAKGEYKPEPGEPKVWFTQPPGPLSETHREWLAAQNQDFERNGLWSDGLVAWRDG